MLIVVIDMIQFIIFYAIDLLPPPPHGDILTKLCSKKLGFCPEIGTIFCLVCLG